MLKDGQIVNGVIKWFNLEKGYGFIVPDGESKEIFFHITRVQKDFKITKNLTAQDNMRVTFTCKQGNQGMMANHVSAE